MNYRIPKPSKNNNKNNRLCQRILRFSEFLEAPLGIIFGMISLFLEVLKFIVFDVFLKLRRQAGKVLVGDAKSAKIRQVF